jgi:RNA polymerase sigma-70 factor (ECF subfamily)
VVGRDIPDEPWPIVRVTDERPNQSAGRTWWVSTDDRTPDPDPGATDADDARLIAAIVGGDREALAALYDRHATRLRWVALGIVRNPADADDLVHDVFLEAWRRAADFDPARGTVRRWLVIRTWSRAIDRVTQARDRRDARDRLELGGVFDPPGAGGDVHRALATLGDEHRRLLGLIYVGGLTTTEAAIALELPVGTVKSRLSAALARLRAFLRGEA